MDHFLKQCEAAIGEENVLTQVQDQAPFLQDRRGRSQGSALAVLRPHCTEQVAQLVRLCLQYRVAITPQGGNTGLVLGSIPNCEKNVGSADSAVPAVVTSHAVILSLKRLNQIRAIDVHNHSITVEAGCLLQQVQQAALEADTFFPLSLASEGSCTLGGNLSTNAGGTAVLRYGNARELCLGLEVVTPQGDIWNGLRGLRKDNTGYDLKNLMIGAEGTLGIITAAVLKLFPKVHSQACAWVVLDDVASALQLFSLARENYFSSLSAFEIMNALSVDLVHRHFPQYQRVFKEGAPYFALLEFSSHEAASQAQLQCDKLIHSAYELGIIRDAVIASSNGQAQQFWAIREAISEAQAKAGGNIKHDIGLPISQIPDFVACAEKALALEFPNCRLVNFGHMGDGNLHFNVSAPLGQDATAFFLHQSRINQIVHDITHSYGGTFSAEHGIGCLKKEELRRYKSATEIQMMRSIKRALDPHNMMNPGKIFTED